MVAMPPENERVIKTPPVLSMLLGESQTQWGRDPEVNEYGAYIFAHTWGIPSIEMERIISYLRVGLPPCTEKALEKLQNAFARFAGCEELDEFIRTRDDEEAPEELYNPRSPEDDYKNLFDWSIGGMRWTRSPDFELVGRMVLDDSMYGVFRKQKE